MKKWHWEEMGRILENDGPFQSVRAAAKWLEIPYGTVYDAFREGKLPIETIVHTKIKKAGPVTMKELNEGDQAFSFSQSGNTATLKFKAAEPLSAEEMMELASIDPDEWRIATYEIGAWQLGPRFLYSRSIAGG